MRLLDGDPYIVNLPPAQQALIPGKIAHALELLAWPLALFALVAGAAGGGGLLLLQRHLARHLGEPQPVPPASEERHRLGMGLAALAALASLLVYHQRSGNMDELALASGMDDPFLAAMDTRLGLQVHSTAGFIDPGFDGHVTLELANVANLPITLYPGMKIGQMSFMDLDGPAEKPYGSGSLGSKYQGQVGPTPSAYWRNFQ